MNFKNLFVCLTLKDVEEKFPVEGFQKNETTGHKELLITLFGQRLWVDAYAVKLYKGRGSTFCWKDRQEGRYIELTDKNEVCPECGWWKCHYCGSCRCNKLNDERKSEQDNE